MLSLTELQGPGASRKFDLQGTDHIEHCPWSLANQTNLIFSEGIFDEKFLMFSNKDILIVAVKESVSLSNQQYIIILFVDTYMLFHFG